LWIDILAADNDQARAALVEVKGFENVASFAEYFGCVIGQYMMYKVALGRLDAAIPLYLAVPSVAY